MPSYCTASRVLCRAGVAVARTITVRSRRTFMVTHVMHMHTHIRGGAKTVLHLYMGECTLGRPGRVEAFFCAFAPPPPTLQRPHARAKQTVCGFDRREGTLDAPAATLGTVLCSSKRNAPVRNFLFSTWRIAPWSDAMYSLDANARN
eukprot:6363229-Prymnesium_polylepis.1